MTEHKDTKKPAEKHAEPTKGKDADYVVPGTGAYDQEAMEKPSAGTEKDAK